MKYLNKTIEYGLYLLVFLLPIQTRWIIKAGDTEYLSYSLYGTDILLILVLLLFAIYKFLIFNFQFSNNFQLINFPTKPKFLTWYFIGGLALMSAVSVFFAASKLLALYKLGWLILGIGLFWLIVSANYNRLKLIYAMLYGLFFQAFLGIWQFLTQSSFANKWLGMASHDGANLGVSVIETIGADGIGERWLRAYAGLDHPNVLGGMLAIGIILFINDIISRKELFNFQFSIFNFQIIFNDKISKAINWAFLVVFTAALFFSFSRAAWLGLTVGLMVLLFGAVIKKDWLAQKNILQTILISGAVIFILFLQYPNLAITRLYAGDRLEVKSTNERVESIKNSWPIIKNNWLFGAGLGNYTLALSRQMPEQEIFYYQPAHSVYLLVLSEIGILGSAFFIGLIVYLIIFNFQFSILKQFSMNKFLKPSLEIRSCKLKIGENDYVNNLMFSIPLLITMAVMMTFDHWSWSLHFGMLFFWLVLGLASCKPQPVTNNFFQNCEKLN